MACWLAKARVAAWRRRFALAALGLSAILLAAVWNLANWYMGQHQRLGVIRFPISCGWQSQADFTTAPALLHLFRFTEAEDVYRSLVVRDPDCAIGYWGIAMSRLQNPLYALPSSEDENIARQALTSAAGARKATPRERAYLAAVATLFDPRSEWHAREIAYARALENVVAQYEDDREAVIFYALGLNLVGGAAEKTKAAQLLLLAFSEEPDHPGIDHYLMFCLGHAAYQPKPFERAPSATPAQRISLAVFALFALGALGIFVTLTADLRPGASSARRIGGPFVLTAPDGTMVTDQTFRDRWMLVYFGYTRCLDVCPTVLRAIAQLIEKLGPSGACVQPIFISFDPERDTPKAVGEFTKAFSPRIIGLTGTPDEVAVVARQYRVFPRRIPGQPPDDDYRIEHLSCLYVIGPDCRFVTLFLPEQAKDPDGMYSQLRGLLSPSGQDHEADSAAKISMMTAVHPQDRLAAVGEAK